MPPKLEKTLPGVACRCTAFVRDAAGGASPDFGAAEAVLVLVVAHVPGQGAVARRVEGPERDGESPLKNPVKPFKLKARVRSCKPVRGAISVGTEAMPLV